MVEIKPNLATGDEDEFFNPMEGLPDDGSAVGIKPVCCCGYELLKESEDTWRCSGGNHRYRISEGEICFDKNGNPLIKLPEDFEDDKKKKNKYKVN